MHPGRFAQEGLFQLALDGEGEGLLGSGNSMGKDMGAGEHGESWASLSGVASKATLWGKAQHEGALPPPCIVRKDPRVPHTARRGA